MMNTTATDPSPRHVAAILDRDATAETWKRDGTASAPVAYALRAAHVKHLLGEIAAGLELHQAHQSEKPRDWGYVGDLGHVSELLDQVVLSLPGTDDPAAVTSTAVIRGDD